RRLPARRSPALPLASRGPQLRGAREARPESRPAREGRAPLRIRRRGPGGGPGRARPLAFARTGPRDLRGAARAAGVLRGGIAAAMKLGIAVRTMGPQSTRETLLAC